MSTPMMVDGDDLPHHEDETIRQLSAYMELATDAGAGVGRRCIAQTFPDGITKARYEAVMATAGGATAFLFPLTMHTEEDRGPVIEYLLEQADKRGLMPPSELGMGDEELAGLALICDTSARWVWNESVSKMIGDFLPHR